MSFRTSYHIIISIIAIALVFYLHTAFYKTHLVGEDDGGVLVGVLASIRGGAFSQVMAYNYSGQAGVYLIIRVVSLFTSCDITMIYCIICWASSLVFTFSAALFAKRWIGGGSFCINALVLSIIPVSLMTGYYANPSIIAAAFWSMALLLLSYSASPPRKPFIDIFPKDMLFILSCFLFSCGALCRLDTFLILPFVLLYTIINKGWKPTLYFLLLSVILYATIQASLGGQVSEMIHRIREQQSLASVELSEAVVVGLLAFPPNIILVAILGFLKLGRNVGAIVIVPALAFIAPFSLTVGSLMEPRYLLPLAMPLGAAIGYVLFTSLRKVSWESHAPLISGVRNMVVLLIISLLTICHLFIGVFYQSTFQDPTLIKFPLQKGGLRLTINSPSLFIVAAGYRPAGALLWFLNSFWPQEKHNERVAKEALRIIEPSSEPIAAALYWKPRNAVRLRLLKDARGYSKHGQFPADRPYPIYETFVMTDKKVYIIWCGDGFTAMEMLNRSRVDTDKAIIQVEHTGELQKLPMKKGEILLKLMDNLYLLTRTPSGEPKHGER